MSADTISLSRRPSMEAASPTVCAVAYYDEWQILNSENPSFRGTDGSGNMMNRFRAPYAHVNLVVCETMDRYKATIRDKVKAWVDERTEKQEEWLLVYVPIGTQNNTHDVYVKIYAKLSADFCAKGPGDKSCMLTVFEGGLTGPLAAATSAANRDALQPSSQEQWTELVTKLKAGVLSAAASRFKQLDEEVKRLEAARLSPDWSFFTFFFAKENLGLMYEQLQLPAEALRQYEELSGYCDRWQKLLPANPPKHLMVFTQQRAGQATTLATIEFPIADFRARLEAQLVGILEVQQYLFSREAAFLTQLGQHAALVQRSHTFIRLQFHTLRGLASSGPDGFPPECAQLWALTAAWAVSRAAEDHLKMQKQLGGGTAASALSPPRSPSKEGARKEGSPAGPPPKPPRSAVLLPDEERLVQMSRQLSEVLDFCRLRFLEVATSLLGEAKMAQQSFVCAARRELSAGPLALLPPSSAAQAAALASSASPEPVSLDDISVKVEPEGSAGDGAGADEREVEGSLTAMLARSPWVREALTSVRRFDEHYLSMTEGLARHLERASRDRHTGRVQAERATVLLKLGQFEDARRVLRGLAEGVYRRDNWAPILSQILSQLAVCEKERGNAKTYVSALLQVLSLNSRDDRVAQYLPEVDDFVRNRMSVRLLKPLDLLVTARVKAAPNQTVEVGGTASVRLWLANNLRTPLTLDGALLLLGEVTDLRRRRRLGQELGWLTSTGVEIESPISPRGGAAPSVYDEEVNECLLWRLPGPLTLPPGVSELELSPPCLPPPGTYVYERLLLPWGQLSLEQDQLTGLDNDTVDLITKQRAPPRRFSAISRMPTKRGVAFRVVPRPVAACLRLGSYPIIPPDCAYKHHVSLLIDTAIDSLHDVSVTFAHSPPGALAFKPKALLAFYPYRSAQSPAAALTDGASPPPAEGGKDGDGEEPLSTQEVDLEWDGTVAQLALPDLEPRTSLVVSMQLNVMPEVMQRFAAARQDQTLAVDIEVELAAEVNRDSFKPLQPRPNSQSLPLSPSISPTPLSPSITASSSSAASPRRAGSRKGASINTAALPTLDTSASPSPSSPSQSGTPPRPSSLRSPSRPSSTSSLRHEQPASPPSALSPSLQREATLPSSPTPPDGPQRSSLRTSMQVMIQQPFTVTITVQDCPSPADASPRPPRRRYLVQAVLHSHAPIALTLHDCRLRIPPAYTLLHAANGHLHDLPLLPSQAVHYAYLIERQPNATAPPLRDARHKMSVSADYSWDMLSSLPRRVRRHHPPQQQHFERYFQDNPMAASVSTPTDQLRTFVVKADVRRNSEDATHTLGRIPAAAHTALPGRDVDERGVVVGYFRNHVMDAYVGASLRLEISVELSEEAQREMDRGEGQGGRRGLRLAYEVAADAADWAVSGFAKGTLEMKRGEAAVVECHLVPIRIGMLTCPYVDFRPVDVRQAVSPRSRRKSAVRWVGPRDIQVFPFHATQSRYPVCKIQMPASA